MTGWWGKLTGKQPEPLRGAPAVPRLKTYSAQSGYVYQYSFAGQRAAGVDSEFAFDVSPDSKTAFRTMVVVEGAALQAWEAAHGRALVAQERYAAAKLALFQAFDERAKPALMHEPVRVRPADIEALLESIGLE